MSNPTPLLRPERPAEPMAYRPVSGLAIASLLLAISYVIVLSVMAIVAITHHDLLIAPVWTFVLALAAIVLALVAGVQIRGSEGTRTGAGLARLGLWLSLLPLLAYVAYSYGNYLAVVRVQAERFSQSWFDDLRKGDVREAFLLTRRPRDRAAARNDPNEFDVRWVWADRDKKGDFTTFEQHDLIRSIVDGGSTVKVESLGIQDWDYQQNAYMVRQSFRIQTPEAISEVILSLRGVMEGSRRQWQIVWTPQSPITISATHPTALGVGVKTWQSTAETFAQQWIKRRQIGDLVGCYLLTRPLDERMPLVQAYCAREASLAMVLPTGSAIFPVNQLVSTNRAVITGLFQGSADYGAFLAGKLITWDPKTFQADETGKAVIGPMAQRFFARPGHVGFMVPPHASPRPRLLADDGVQMDVDVNIGIREQVGNPGAMPTFQCTGVLTLESKGVSIDRQNQPHWRVVGVRLISGSAPDAPTFRKPLPHRVVAPAPTGEFK